MSQQPKTRPQDRPEVLANYRRLIAEARQLLVIQEGAWWRWGWLRGSLFLVALAGLGVGVTDASGWGRIGWYLLAGGLTSFLFVAGWHETLAERIRVGRRRLQMYEAGLARVERRLADLSQTAPPLPSLLPATARDLDLFGVHSLYRLVGTVRTPQAVSLLTDWLINGARAGVIKDRQGAVGALREAGEWRHDFEMKCEQLSLNQSSPSDFVQWCQRPSWLGSRAILLWLSRVCGVILLALAAMTLLGLMAFSVSGPWMLAAALINFLLSVFWAGPIHEIFNQVSSRHAEARCYLELFQAVRSCPATSPRLQQLRTQIFQEGDVLGGLGTLGTWVWLANLRRNGILFLVYLVFQFLFFWDLHVLWGLERWKSRYGKWALHWFRDLGEWETLSALAKFAADHPEWIFPEVREPQPGGMVWQASQLGHPLLPPESRVDNDVHIGPQGTFLLVTGSNMSGKSTLLRSIGLNSVLAQLGTVVCAQSLVMPSVVVDTSMRISDSLADGVSFFMAELQRLKQIVDRSRRIARDSECSHLFLLDEILQGTNSRERQIAVAQVVRQLIEQGSLGAISTHDLELASVSDLQDRCTVVHFSEHFVQRDGVEVMAFDYRMKSGVAPTTNALKLLQLVGLGSSSASIDD